MGQCDQMGRILFIIWLLTIAQICPKFIRIAKVCLKFCQTKNKPSTVCLRFLKFAQVAKFRQIWSRCERMTTVDHDWRCQQIMAELTERSLHISEDPGSNRAIGWSVKPCFHFYEVSSNFVKLNF